MIKEMWKKDKGSRLLAVILSGVLLVLTGMAAYAEGIHTWRFPLFLLLSLAAGAYLLLKQRFGLVRNSLTLVVVPFLSMWLLQWFTCDPWRMYPKMILLNCIFFYLFFLGLSFLLGSFRRGYCIAAVLSMVVGIANYFVVEFRSSPIVPWDLLSVGTAASVADNYTYTVTWRLLSIVMGYIFMILTAAKMNWKPKKLKIRVPAFVCCLALLLTAGIAIQKKSVKDFFEMDQTLFTPNVRYRNNGFAAAFIGNLYLINIQKPDNYSVQKVETIAAQVRADHDRDAGKKEGTTEAGSIHQQDKKTAASNDQKETEGVMKANPIAEEKPAMKIADAAGEVSEELSEEQSAVDAPEELLSEQSTRAAAELSSAPSGEGIHPNIIVIMDEAFSDLSLLGEFETNEDYMPFMRSLMEEYTSGHLMVSVKGGNTANSEYEFLSGDTMAFLPSGSVVYQQYIKGEVPTIATQLAQMGYTTTGIHPYLAKGWDRERVYPLMGFQSFVDIDSFADARYIRNYVSDESAFDKIIEVFERGKRQKQFIFEVTMQNHSGYSKDYPGFAPTIDLVGMSATSTSVQAAEKYLTLIQESDKAFERLIQYFQQVDEPTIIVMFGDHQPSDYITNVIARATGYDQEASLEEYQKTFQVPFVIWDNMGLEKDSSMELSSVNYLGAYLMEMAGLPLSTYQEFLLELREELPVVCSGTYVDSTGTYHSWSEEKGAYSEILNDYNILQYNHLTDAKNRVEDIFISK